MSSTTDQGQTPDPPASVQDILTSAATGQVTLERIAEISDPSREQVRDFQTVWDSLSLSKRREIIREMVRQGDEDLEVDFNRYFRVALRDEDAEIRALAVQGLWEDDTSSYLMELCNLALTDEDPAVQETVATALGQFSYLAETGELPPEQVERLRQALFALMSSGDNWMVRRRALESAAYLSHDEQINAAISDAAQSDFERERAGALIAMGRNLDERWFPTILAEMRNEDPDIRCEAARAAGQFGDSSAIDQLTRMVDDEDDEIRHVAVEAIGRIGGRRAIDTLRFLEKEAPEELQEPIKRALEEAEFLAESTGMERE